MTQARSVPARWASAVFLDTDVVLEALVRLLPPQRVGEHRDEHEPGHPGEGRRRGRLLQALAVDRSGLVAAGPVRAGGEHHSVMTGQLRRQLSDRVTNQVADDRGRPGLVDGPGLGGVAVHATHLVAAGDEPGGQPPADAVRGTDQENLHVLRPLLYG